MEERTKSGKGPRGPTLLRILMLCTGGFAVEMAYMIEEGYGLPAMLATGVPETVASAMWAVGPLLGLLFQGYLGSASDRCTCAWGKRRPFIVCLAVCAGLATLLFPYGTFVSGSVLGLSEKNSGVFVMVFTAFTFVAMDFSLDALQSPLRAYLIDSVPTERSEQAHFTFTALLCVGAIAGSLIAGIPWYDFTKGDGSTKQSNYQVEMVYGIATVLFVACTLVCLNSIKEKNPTTQISPSVERKLSLPLAVTQMGNDYNPTFKQPPSQIMTRDELNSKLSSQVTIPNGIHSLTQLRAPSPISRSASPCFSSVLQITSPRYLRSMFADVFYDLHSTILFSQYMSTHFYQLCLTVFFNWISFLSMMLYFTSFMGQVVYDGSPHAPSGNEKREVFDYGVRIGFLVILFQDFASTTSCLSMKWLSDRVGTRQLYVGGLATYTVICFVTATWPTLVSALFLQVIAGLVYSNLQSIPYTLISHYQVFST